MTSHLHSYTIKRTVRTLGAILIALLVAGGLAVLVFKIFTIQELMVDAPGMVIELDRSKFGNNLLFLPADRLRKELFSNYPLLQQVTFEKKYPSTLIVHLTKKAPFAVLHSGSNYYAVDEEGSIVGVLSEKGNYPLIDIELGIWSIGSQIHDTRLTNALQFIKATKSFFPIHHISEHDSSSLTAEGEDTNIFIPQKGEILGKATTLQVIIEGFRIKGKLPTVIDLRFDKPIITN